MTTTSRPATFRRLAPLVVGPEHSLAATLDRVRRAERDAARNPALNPAGYAQFGTRVAGITVWHETLADARRRSTRVFDRAGRVYAR